MFTIMLFTVAKYGNNLNCPSKDEWIEKMWYIYIVEDY